jgi:hypothetical protein
MKITKHISFYFLESRMIYINRILDETNQYKHTTDIFIHTNIHLKKDLLNPYTNGTIHIIYHDLTNMNPYHLTWKCRDLLKQQQHDYDIFMYIEDDILVPYKAIQYWLDNQSLIDMNYNLGFVRIEVDNHIEYITDLYGEKLDTILTLNDKKYCVNNKNPYCAFWIYHKSEFNRFVNSKYYNPNTISGYGIREQSAIGLHGTQTHFYKNTLIPMIHDKLIDECKIYHMPNNYVLDKTSRFATIKFDDAVHLPVR